MTYPSYVNAGTFATDTNNTLTPGLPASRTNGNVLIAFVHYNGSSATQTWSLDAGSTSWTIFASLNQGGSHPMVLAWRLVDGTEAAPKFNVGTANTICGQVYQYTGVVASPIGAISSHTAGSSSTVTCPAITTLSDSSLAVNIVCIQDSTAIASPSGWNAETHTNSASGSPTASDLQIATTGSSSGSTSVTATVGGYDNFIFELFSQSPAATGSAAGVGAASAQAAGQGSADGVGAASALGLSYGSAVGAGAGAAAGASTASSIGSAAGVGVAAAQTPGKGYAAGVGAAAAQATGQGYSAGLGTAIAHALSQGYTAGVGRASAQAAGQGRAAGIGEAAPVGASTASSIGSAVGVGASYASVVFEAAGPFFFAWANASETTFGPQHYRTDEHVFSFEYLHEEGQCATLSLVIKNPLVPLLGPGRRSWAWFSKRLADGSIVPRGFFRLVAVPGDMTDEVVTIHMVARPPDMIDQQRAVAGTLMVRPYWDPVFLTPERRSDPDAILEGYSASWHIDPITHVVSTSDWLVGEDEEEEFLASDSFYDSVKIDIGQAPLQSVRVDSDVQWDQRGYGSIPIGNGFMFDSSTGAGLVSAWPKAGTTLEQGWSVKHSGSYDSSGNILNCNWHYTYTNTDDAHNFGDTMTSDESLSTAWMSALPSSFLQAQIGQPPGLIFSAVTNENSAGVEGDEEAGIAAWGNYTITKALFFAWTVFAWLTMQYIAIRPRTETVRFVLPANLQPVFTDPGGIAADFAQDSELLKISGKVGIEGPYGTYKGDWTPSTPYYMFDLLTTHVGEDTFGWQVLRDHVSLPFFDFETCATAGGILDVGDILYSGGIYLQVLSSINAAGHPRFGITANPHAGRRMYQQIPNFAGNWEPNGEILVAGQIVIAPSGDYYQVAIGHRTAATFDHFFPDPDGTGALVYEPLLNPPPIGDLSRRSYFPTDRGLWSLENLIARARAKLIYRSRVATVSFDCFPERAWTMTLRQNARLHDRRLMGGEALGKITTLRITGDGDRGTFIGTITISPAVGLGLAVQEEAGTPEWADDNCVDPDCQFHAGKIVALGTGDVSYSPPVDAVIDDGLVFPLDYRQAVAGQSISITDGLAGADVTNVGAAPPSGSTQAAGGIASAAQARIAAFETNISNAMTAYTLALRPVQNGPFAAQYDITVSALEIPEQITVS